MAKGVRSDSTEHDEQKALFKWIALHKTRYPALEMAFAIPNGGKRDEITGARLRDEGVMRGVPDVCLPVPSDKWYGRSFHGLFIEMKYGQNTTTPEQDWWLTHLPHHGYLTAICYGWQEAVGVICEYLGIEGDE